MGLLDFFIQRDEPIKKTMIDPNKPLKGQLDENQSVTPSIVQVQVNQESEIYKKVVDNIQTAFNNLDTGKTSYHSFLKQIEFLKDAIPDKTILFAKAFQMLQKDGGDKYQLQQSAATVLEQLKLQQKQFNDLIIKKKEETEKQTLTDIELTKSKILNLEKEINEAKLKLQELSGNIAVSKSNFDERSIAYNEVSDKIQTSINQDLKDIQKLIN